MKVYQIDFSVDKYRQLALNREDDAPLLRLDGKPILGVWKPIEFHVLAPRLKIPDFWYVGNNGGFAFDAKAVGSLFGQLESCGEILDIAVEGVDSLSLLNVTEIHNALDVQNTKWFRTDAGKHQMVAFDSNAYVFIPDRVPEFPLFRIPQNNSSQIFCCERSGSPREEFKAAYEFEKCKGLEFKLVWQG